MSIFESIVFPAIITGLSAVAIPGPLQAYLLNVTLRYGWRRGIMVIFAPLVVDGPVILVTVFLLGQLPDLAIQVIRVLGGLLLLWIAWGAVQQLRAGAGFNQADDPTSDVSSPLRVLGTAVAMAFLSPGPYLFWATINGPLLLLAIETSALAVLGMLLGFYGTFLGGLALLVAAFDRLGKVDDRLTSIILRVTIVLLVWFGTQLIAEAFGLLAIHQLISLLALLGSCLYLGLQRLAKR